MKQVILVRKDLKMDKGKLAVQAAHASVQSFLKSSWFKRKKWVNNGMKKVILKVSSLNDLLKYKKLAESNHLRTALIKDAGKTFFKKPTVTCLAIGPDEEKKIDKVTGSLPMY